MTFEEYYQQFGPRTPYFDIYLSQKMKELFSRAWSISEQNKNHPFCHTPEEFIMRFMCIPMLYTVSESRAMRDDEKMACEIGNLIGTAITVTQLCQVARAAWGLPFNGSVIVISQDMVVRGDKPALLSELDEMLNAKKDD